jgi:hypothetical protein
MTDVHPPEIRSYNMSRIKGGITERVTSLWKRSVLNLQIFELK